MKLKESTVDSPYIVKRVLKMQTSKYHSKVQFKLKVINIICSHAQGDQISDMAGMRIYFPSYQLAELE